MTTLLETTGCRWPLAENDFCNCPIRHKSYCAEHYARAYRTMQPVHPLLVLLATEGPQPMRDAYYGLIKDRLAVYRGNRVYITDRGRKNTPGF